MKKKFLTILMTAVCSMSLIACGNQKPSMEEVEKAIAEGNVTVEDALDKGWVTQDWVDQYLDSHTVDAADKTESFAIDDFHTQTISGDEYTKEDLHAVTFWAFIDPLDDEAEGWYQTLVNSYEKIKEKGAEILICCKNETEISLFKDAPFQVIFYNESVKDALNNMNMSEMIEEMTHTGNWFVDKYFASSWYAKLNADQLIKDADIFIQKYNELNDTDSNNQSANEAATAIG